MLQEFFDTQYFLSSSVLLSTFFLSESIMIHGWVPVCHLPNPAGAPVQWICTPLEERKNLGKSNTLFKLLCFDWIMMEERGGVETNALVEEDLKSNEVKKDKQKIRRKKQLLGEAEMAEKRGVCYLSHIPPHMDPLKLRQILSQFGEIQRIYLTPEDPAAQLKRKRAGGFRGKEFSEGWVEFTKKGVAKWVAKMLNGEQIGGKKRSSFYYDIWNIKYLSKFKWDDLTEEIAQKNAIREQKLAMELSAAKRERDFYLSKVEKSRELSSKEERLKKKQKVQQESGTSDISATDSAPKVIRQFLQKKPIESNAEERKPRLSKDVLAQIFGVMS